MTRNSKIALAVIILVLVVDQVVKILVKTNMQLGDEVAVFGDWFKIHFVENPGMAFGMRLGSGDWAKIALSLFRIIAVGAIGYYLNKVCHTEGKTGYVVCLALVLSGAVGNIIDSIFYGLLFDSSLGQVATFLPDNGGYAGLLHGRVVDMLYFPLIEGRFPNWFPLWGGESFVFFRPVFNIADSAISVGIVLILLLYRTNLSTDLASESEQ